mgnify:CR=1 FL=1
MTEEILLPSDKSRDILLTNAPSSNAAKQSIITFILENVNARSLSALKNKLSPAPQDTNPDNPGGAGNFNKWIYNDGWKSITVRIWLI